MDPERLSGSMQVPFDTSRVKTSGSFPGHISLLYDEEYLV